jgi:hypothetical protein
MLIKMQFSSREFQLSRSIGPTAAGELKTGVEAALGGAGGVLIRPVVSGLRIIDWCRGRESR